MKSTKLYFLFLAIFCIISSYNQLEANNPGNKNVLVYDTYKSRSDLETDFNNFGSVALNILDPNEDEDEGIAPDINFVVSRTAIVKLVYGREARSDVHGKNWCYTVHYDLKDETLQLLGSGTVTISFDHQSGGTYEDQQRFDLGTHTSARLEVTGIDACINASCGCTPVTPDETSDLPTDLRLELGMEVEKIYYFDNIIGPSIDLQEYYTNDQESRVELNWEFLPGACEYELEYVYWDDKDADIPGGGSVPKDLEELKELFLRAIRIVTCNNWHELDISYPSGYVFYRVRGVGRYIRGVSGIYP